VIERVRAGDRGAYAVLVERHQHGVRRVCSGLFDEALVENLVQQTFISGFQNLGRFRVSEDLGAWLRTIAANLMRNELRRAGRERKYLVAYHQQLLLRLAHEDAAEDSASRMQEALSECVQALAPAAAQAIRLRYQDGLGIPAVARAIERTELATRQLLFRARLALRSCAERRLALP
jgi:RNA polymerase sigma-70 factor (ECF subfamily)